MEQQTSLPPHLSLKEHEAEIPAHAYCIQLATGEHAALYMYRRAVITDLDPRNDQSVFTYKVPCPLCKEPNLAHSYDGLAFSGHQIPCRTCGVVFVPRISQTQALKLAELGVR